MGGVKSVRMVNMNFTEFYHKSAQKQSPGREYSEIYGHPVSKGRGDFQGPCDKGGGHTDAWNFCLYP